MNESAIDSIVSIKTHCLYESPSIGRVKQNLRGRSSTNLQISNVKIEIPKAPRPQSASNIFKNSLNGLNINLNELETRLRELHEALNNGCNYMTKQLFQTECLLRHLENRISNLYKLQNSYQINMNIKSGIQQMFDAYKSSPGNQQKNLNQIKQSWKECMQKLCSIEAQTEAFLGTFEFTIEKLIGFSRLCPGDNYEIIIRYGREKFRTRTKIAKDCTQKWNSNKFLFKVGMHDFISIKINEIRFLGKNILVGEKIFEVKDLFCTQLQRMTLNANKSGSIKLSLLCQWLPFENSDETFNYFNPNQYLTINDKKKRSQSYIMHQNRSLLGTETETLLKKPTANTTLDENDLHNTSEQFESLESRSYRTDTTQSCDSSLETITSLEKAFYLLKRKVSRLKVKYIELQTLDEQISAFDAFFQTNIRNDADIERLSIDQVSNFFEFLNIVENGLGNENENFTQEGDNLNATKSYSSELFDSSQSEDEELRNNQELSLTSESNKSPVQNFITTNNYQIDFLLLMHFIFAYSLLNNLNDSEEDVYTSLNKEVDILKIIHEKLITSDKATLDTSSGNLLIIDSLINDKNLKEIWLYCTDSEDSIFYITKNALNEKLCEYFKTKINPKTIDNLVKYLNILELTQNQLVSEFISVFHFNTILVNLIGNASTIEDYLKQFNIEDETLLNKTTINSNFNVNNNNSNNVQRV